MEGSTIQYDGAGEVPSVLNPYRISAGLMVKRLLWDLTLNSWIHRKKIASLRNKHIGEKAVIVCNGPSLNDIDLSSLSGVFTFGLNKINLIFDQTDFRPSCIVAVNPTVLNQNKLFFSSTDIPLFLDKDALRYAVKPRKNVHMIHSCDYPHFAGDCSLSIFQGFTVTFVALQLAYHMGFTRIALVGCDHHYSVYGRPNSMVRYTGKSQSHFTDDYVKSGEEFQIPDLNASEYAYELARRHYEEDRRSIVNASTQSALTVFQRQPLHVFLDEV